MFGQLGLPELLIILVIVILLFGVGRISNIAGELGKSIRAFREGLKDNDNKPKEDKKDKPDDANQDLPKDS